MADQNIEFGYVRMTGYNSYDLGGINELFFCTKILAVGNCVKFVYEPLKFF